MKVKYVVFPILVLLTGCGGGGSDDGNTALIPSDADNGEVIAGGDDVGSNDTNSQQNVTPSNVEITPVVGGVYAPLVGTWSRCLSDDLDNISESSTWMYLADGTWSLDTREYNSSDCQGEPFRERIGDSQDYVILGTRITSEGLTAAIFEWRPFGDLADPTTVFLVVDGDALYFASDFQGELTTALVLPITRQ